MNRIVFRATVCVLVFLLSGATAPLLAQQQQQAPTEQPAQNSTQPPIELPENPGRSTTPPAAAQIPRERSRAKQFRRLLPSPVGRR